MKKLLYIVREMFRLIGRNKLWFLLPIVLCLAVLGFVVYSLGPVAAITFLYAGI